MPTEILGIKRGNFGSPYRIVVKNANYSAYGAKVYVESSGGTMLINGSDCVVSATDSSKNTLVLFTPASGQFGFAASYVKYNVEVTFSGGGFRDSTDTFSWKVERELR